MSNDANPSSKAQPHLAWLLGMAFVSALLYAFLLKLSWQFDLTDRFGSIPVQFGFSSSPIIDDGNIYLLAGGQRGGLVCLDVATGQPRWNVP